MKNARLFVRDSDTHIRTDLFGERDSTSHYLDKDHKFFFLLCRYVYFRDECTEVLSLFAVNIKKNKKNAFGNAERMPQLNTHILLLQALAICARSNKTFWALTSEDHNRRLTSLVNRKNGLRRKCPLFQAIDTPDDKIFLSSAEIRQVLCHVYAFSVPCCLCLPSCLISTFFVLCVTLTSPLCALLFDWSPPP